jgi:DUF1680 family protein
MAGDVNICTSRHYDANLLGGVTFLEGRARKLPLDRWSRHPYIAEQLYQPVTDQQPQPFQLKLMPYHVWSNRGVSQMSVWLPLVWYTLLSSINEACMEV